MRDAATRPSRPLAGRKIAVLVESLYIPEEIEAYKQDFAALGARVDLMTRLWGKASNTFVSDPDGLDPTGVPRTAQTLTVDIDFEHVDLADYAAVIMSANYTSVRLRYFEPPQSPAGSPAVAFFARAMMRPDIIKGALCHGLWILTPRPALLRGRRVICHEVVQADVENAGAQVVRDQGTVVVDGDLVTGHSKDDVHAFIQAIARQIARGDAMTQTDVRRSPAPLQRCVLCVLSEWGYWGEELVGPLEVLEGAGFTVDFATPTGKRPVALTPSMDPTYVDPPLGRSVTTPEVAAKVRALDDPSNPRLSNPIDLAAWLPDYPYHSDPQYLRLTERYRADLGRVAWDIGRYDALLLVGGSGPIVDLANNHRVHDLLLAFYRAGKPIAAECYAVACLAFARDLEDRVSIIRGKHVTGHCKEYDYKTGTGFMGTAFEIGPPPYPLEYILRDATAPGGAYHGNYDKPTSVIVDHPFITGRSTPDSYLTGQKLLEVLTRGLTRWGW